MKTLSIAVAVLVVSNLASASIAYAQQYPSRPIRLVVAIPPGGAPDVVARVLANKLGPALGQAVVVENRAGANGNIAAAAVATAAPDGYTLLLGQDSIFVINPHLYKRMPVDVRRDLLPVTTVASNMIILALNPAVPVKTFAEFVEYARKANPPMSYASGGNGSQHHLTMEMLKQRAVIDLLHVPYKGGTPAATATMAGEVAAMFSGTSSAPQAKAGKLRAIAVTGKKRSDLFPELPTIAEFYPGFETTIWLGVFAPATTPAPILARLREEIAKALAAPDVKDSFHAAGGLQPLELSPAEFTSLIQRDSTKYENIVRQTGITLD